MINYRFGSKVWQGRRLLLSLFLSLFALCSFWGAWKYSLSISQQGFEDDILKVKQSFYEGMKAVESATFSLQSFVEVSNQVSQENFGKFSESLIAFNPAMVNINYYKKIPSEKRFDFEQYLRTTALGTTLMEGGIDGKDVVAAQERKEYLVLAAANAKAKENTYFGWDLLSDPSKLPALEQAKSQNKTVASSTYLLDNGNVALDVFIPVAGSEGFIGVTTDLTKLLGDNGWHKAVTIILSTILSGESTPKNIFRSLDKEVDGHFVFWTLTSTLEIERFGQKLGLNFQKDLIASRINFGPLGMVLFGVILLSLLAFYLLLTYEKVEEANATLEKKVEERTKDLSLANKEIKEILDHLDDLVVTIDPDLKIGDTHSPASLKILGVEKIAQQNLKDVLFSGLNKNEEKASRHLFALDTLKMCDDFQWSMNSFELLKVVQYKSPDGKEKTLSLRYSPIFLADVITKLVVVASDITEILSLRASVAEQEKASSLKNAILSEIANAQKSQLKGFFEESQTRMDHIKDLLREGARDGEGTSPSQKIILRELHTLKGGARTVGFKHLAATIHEVESILGEEHEEKGASPKEEGGSKGEGTGPLEKIIKTYDGYYHFYQDVFAGESLDATWKQLYPKISSLLRSKNFQPQSMETWLSALKEEKIFSLREFFLEFQKGLEEVAEQIGKKLELVPSAKDLYFAKELRPIFSEAFTHGLRNALDHGIESPEEREKAGKLPVGHIELHFSEESEGLSVLLKDDGRGVNIERVYKLAFSKGLTQKPMEAHTKEEIIDFLFAHGFSTKEEVSELSGRGVGLDAVRASCIDFSIHCSILSTPGLGSQFKLHIPKKFGKFLLSSDGSSSQLAVI